MSSYKKGWLMAVTGASLWGLSGTAAQTLFQQESVDPEWLVTVRMLTAGLLLLAFSSLRQGGIWCIWRQSPDRWQLVVFGILGMLGVQYTYFAAIDAGNAATATLLQFLGPIFITLYMSLKALKLPLPHELAALGLAFVGTFLLITNGSVDSLSVPADAVLWGLASGVTAAFYMVYPARILERWGSANVVGWGMVIGGALMCLWTQPWSYPFDVTPYTVAMVGFVVVFGTLLPFFLLLESLRHISPSTAGCLSSAEPLTAALASAIWLKMPMSLIESLGGACIVATVLLLSMNRTANTKTDTGPLSTPGQPS